MYGGMNNKYWLEVRKDLSRDQVFFFMSGEIVFISLGIIRYLKSIQEWKKLNLQNRT